MWKISKRMDGKMFYKEKKRQKENPLDLRVT